MNKCVTEPGNVAGQWEVLERDTCDSSGRAFELLKASPGMMTMGTSMIEADSSAFDMEGGTPCFPYKQMRHLKGRPRLACQPSARGLGHPLPKETVEYPATIESDLSAISYQF